MTIRTSDLGGTDWDNNSPFKSSDFNDTFNAVTYRYKKYTSAGEDTTTSTSFEDTDKTFTITHPADSLLVGITITAEMKTNNNSYGTIASLKISGTSLGTYSLSRRSISQQLLTDELIDYPSVHILDSEAGLFSLAAGGSASSYTKLYASATANLILPDTTTTFTVRHIVSSGGTGYVKNVEITVSWIEGYKDDS